jgi:ribosome-binding ATPase
MKIGLYGYEGSGASTLFNALTGQEVPTGFGSNRKTHIGTVKIPDPRIDKLTVLYKPKKTIYTELIFSDFPSGGKGTAKSLSNVSEAKASDMLALVVQGFNAEWMAEKADPLNELENLLTEMVLSDLEQVERYMERLRRFGKKNLDPFIMSAMEKALPHLEDGKSLRTLEFTTEEVEHIRGFSFLSSKPTIVAVNVDEDKYKDPVSDAILSVAKEHEVEPFVLSAKIEEEISKMSPEDQEMFLEDLGIDEQISGRFLRASYKLASLISFFTVGPDEVRSWTIRKGTKAKAAAGVIHSDLEKGFIRAEVFTYDHIVEAKGSEPDLKKLGRIRLEGKEYEVLDADILNIRFNV